MDLRRLGLFLAVVDHDGFTAAARAVHVAQPAVSLAVKELEQELGSELLVRSRSGVTLTPAGAALVPPARRALQELDIATASVAAVTGLVAGRLDVVCLPSLTADPAAELVGHFRRAHPGVTVRVLGARDPADLADAVRSGRAEVGITVTGPEVAALDHVALSDQQLRAVVPPGGSGADGAAIDLRDLDGRPLVVTPPGTSLRTMVDAAFASLDITPTVAVETDQRDAVVPLVLAGAGTGFVPRGLAGAAAALGARVHPTDPPLHRRLLLVGRPGARSPAADRFHGLAVDDGGADDD